MRWKLFTSAALGAAMMLLPVQENAFAADFSVYEEYEKAIGLIEKCTLSCSNDGDGILNITAKTQVSSSMEEIGYKSITIQFSEDGEEWRDYRVLADIMQSDSRYFNINNLHVQVYDTGYYRVVCEHYAKGVPFGKNETQIQAVYNESSVSYMDNPIAKRTAAKTTTEKQTSTTTSKRTIVRKTTKTTVKTAVQTTEKIKKNKVKKEAPTEVNEEIIETTKTKTTASQKKTTTSSQKNTTSKSISTTTSANKKEKSDLPGTNDRFPIEAAVGIIGSAVLALSLKKKK